MDSEQIKNILAERYGMSEENTPLLNDMLRRATNVISELFPALETGSLETEKNVTRYTVEMPEGHSLIRVKEVFYNSPTNNSVFNDVDIPLEGFPHGSSLSQRFTDVFEHETRRVLKPIDARIVNNDKFDLIPTPQDVRTIYYEYERYRTLDEIPQFLEEEFFALVNYFNNDVSYQKSRRENNGSVFDFDRRGNTKERTTDVKTDVESRKLELDNIKKDIKAKVNKFG